MYTEIILSYLHFCDCFCLSHTETKYSVDFNAVTSLYI